MRVLPDCTLDDHPPLDVLLVPGGRGAREIEPHNRAVTDWIAKTAEQGPPGWSACAPALSCCTPQGPPAGGASPRTGATRTPSRRVGTSPSSATPATSWTATCSPAQGVSAGIDSALWLVGRLHGREHARAVRREIQYDPSPAYLADEPL
ncbi:hypothetical protein GCM10020219_098970 [Nonomuraea dietziae]